MIAGISRKQLLVAIGVISLITFLLLFAPLSYKFSKNKSANAAGWYSYDWNYRKLITVDHTKVSTDLSNYSMLIKLASDADLVNYAQTDGDDILFTSSDGLTKIPHQIEKYVSSSGELIAWLKLPTLSSIQDDQIYLYYSNQNAGSQQDSSNVWDSDYAYVNHYNQSSGTLMDSTSNANHSIQYGGAIYLAEGKIGDAVSLNGAEDHLRRSHDQSTDSDSLLSITDPSDVWAYDFDGDGDIDLAGSSRYNDVYWLENDGSENFVLHDIYTLWNTGTRSAVTDVDQDGDLDIIATSFYSNQWAWFSNNGSGIFTPSIMYATASQAHSVATGDVDGDGDIDITVTTNAGGTVTWYENDGVETFTSHELSADMFGANTIHVVDLDKDNDMDLLVGRGGASSTYMRVWWYNNDGNQNFSIIDLLGYVRDGAHCLSIDLDNDGDLDIVGGSGHSDVGIRWYENDDNQVFTGRTLKNAIYGVGKPWAADMDSDGDLDIIAKFAYSTTIHSLYLWKNNGVGLFNKGLQDWEDQSGIHAYVSSGGKIQVLLSDQEQDQCKLRSSLEVDDEVFRHLAITWDGNNLKIYFNGVIDASTSCSNVDSINTQNYITLGKGIDSVFDEFRFVKEAFSAEYYLTLYQNQNNPGAFYSLSPSLKGDQTNPSNPNSVSSYKTAEKIDELANNDWYNVAKPFFEWSGALDAQSGIAGYFIYFGATADADPVSSGGFQTGSSYSSNIVLESGSDYYLRFVTRDRAGNDSEPETLFTYKYDSTALSPPSYVNVSPVGCITQSNFDFSWPEAVDEGGSNLFGYQYKRGTSGDIIDANQQLTTQTTAYQEGDNVFYVRSIDNAGNVSAWQTGIYCSTGVAHIIDGPSVASGPSSINVSWITDKPTRGTVLVYEGNEYLTEQSQGGFDNAHSVRVIGLEAEREYRYKITWHDQNSNTGESEWFNTVTETAPSVNNLEYEILSPKAANISFKTSQQSSVVLEYGSGELNNRVDFEGSGTQFSKQLTDLVSGTLYNVRVKATAIQDNTTFYGGTSFVTPPLPSISSLSFESDISGSTPVLIVSWDTNVATTSSVFYKEDNSLTTPRSAI